MADEAVIRVIVQYGSGGNQPLPSISQAAPSSSSSTTQSSTPSSQATSAGQSQPPPRPSQTSQQPARAGQPFDPQAGAERRRESERQRAQVDVAYREKYGEKGKETPLDAIMGVLDQFRGTIGGYFGTLAGMALDIRRGIHEARQKEIKEEYERELLEEARRTTGAVHGVRSAILSASRPAAPLQETKATPPMALPMPQPIPWATPVARPVHMGGLAGRAASIRKPKKKQRLVPKGVINRARQIARRAAKRGEVPTGGLAGRLAGYERPKPIPPSQIPPWEGPVPTLPVPPPPQPHPAQLGKLPYAQPELLRQSSATLSNSSKPTFSQPEVPFDIVRKEVAWMKAKQAEADRLRAVNPPMSSLAGRLAGVDITESYPEVIPVHPEVERIPEAKIPPPVAPAPPGSKLGLSPEAIPVTDIPKSLPAKGAGAAVPEALPAKASMTSSMTGAAAEAGPIIAVGVALTELASGAIKGVVSTIGDVFKGIASPDKDPSVPIEAMGEAASSAGKMIALVVPAVGFMGVAVGETTKALAGMMQALDKTADRYGEYSPQIAQAQAIADVQHTLGDLRRAQEVGPELARYVQAQTDLQEKFEDIKIKLLVKILPAVTRILELIEGVMNTGEGIEKAISVLGGPLTNLADMAAELVGMQRDDRLPDVDDPTELLFQPGGVQVPDRDRSVGNR